MNALFGGIINHTFQAFSTIFIIAMVIIIIGGGLFPESIFEKTETIQNFDVPIVFLERTNSNRAYMKTTYNKANVLSGLGSLEVDYTTSKEDYVGIKTTAYTLTKMYEFNIAARADRPTKLAIRLKDRENKFEFVKVFDIDSTWQTYTFYPADFMPKDYKATLAGGKFAPYLEISVPPSEIEATGKFWIDNLKIHLHY